MGTRDSLTLSVAQSKFELPPVSGDGTSDALTLLILIPAKRLRLKPG